MKSWPCIERTIISGDVKPRNALTVSMSILGEKARTLI